MVRGHTFPHRFRSLLSETTEVIAPTPPRIQFWARGFGERKSAEATVPRHQLVSFPSWVSALRDPALRVVAENAYAGEVFAVQSGADIDPRCTRLMTSARTSLRELEDEKLSREERIAAGQNAATQFGAARMMMTDQGTPPRT